MKTKKNNTKAKLPGFTKDACLDKYSDKVLFKEKVNMANHILKTVGIPKV